MEFAVISGYIFMPASSSNHQNKTQIWNCICCNLFIFIPLGQENRRSIQYQENEQIPKWKCKLCLLGGWVTRTPAAYSLQNSILWPCLITFFNFIFIHKLRFYKITDAWTGKWFIWGNHVIYYIRASLVFPCREETELILRSLWMLLNRVTGKLCYWNVRGRGGGWAGCGRSAQGSGYNRPGASFEILGQSCKPSSFRG